MTTFHSKNLFILCVSLLRCVISRMCRQYRIVWVCLAQVLDKGSFHQIPFAHFRYHFISAFYRFARYYLWSKQFFLLPLLLCVCVLNSFNLIWTFGQLNHTHTHIHIRFPVFCYHKFDDDTFCSIFLVAIDPTQKYGIVFFYFFFFFFTSICFYQHCKFQSHCLSHCGSANYTPPRSLKCQLHVCLNNIFGGFFFNFSSIDQLSDSKTQANRCWWW